MTGAKDGGIARVMGHLLASESDANTFRVTPVSRNRARSVKEQHFASESDATKATGKSQNLDPPLNLVYNRDRTGIEPVTHRCKRCMFPLTPTAQCVTTL